MARRPNRPSRPGALFALPSTRRGWTLALMTVVQAAAPHLQHPLRLSPRVHLGSKGGSAFVSRPRDSVPAPAAFATPSLSQALPGQDLAHIDQYLFVLRQCRGAHTRLCSARTEAGSSDRQFHAKASRIGRSHAPPGMSNTGTKPLAGQRTSHHQRLYPGRAPGE